MKDRESLLEIPRPYVARSRLTNKTVEKGVKRERTTEGLEIAFLNISLM